MLLKMGGEGGGIFLKMEWKGEEYLPNGRGWRNISLNGSGRGRNTAQNGKGRRNIVQWEGKKEKDCSKWEGKKEKDCFKWEGKRNIAQNGRVGEILLKLGGEEEEL